MGKGKFDSRVLAFLKGPTQLQAPLNKLLRTSSISAILASSPLQFCPLPADHICGCLSLARMEEKWDLLSILLCTKYSINLQLGTTLGFISISKTVHDREAETINSESFPTARPRHQHGEGYCTGQVPLF